MASSTPSSRPIWSGSISFGLVTIPVKLFLAVREKRLSFRSLHDQDKVPLKQKLICPADGKEVHREHIVKGYEVEKDQYVVVRESELEAVMPKATRAIEIEDFVSLDEIDPVFFDRAYYVVPKPEGMRPYKLLLDALSKKKKVGIARVVMHNKEYLAALRPVDDALCLETMHFGDEVVPANKMEAVDDKAHGEKVVLRPEAEKAAPRGKDLIAALEASLQKAKAGAGASTHNGKSHGSVRRRKSA